MTSRDFCFWIQGYFEISGPTGLTINQVGIVKNHLALVFKHEIDPSFSGNPNELQAVHDGKTNVIGGTGEDGTTYRC